MGSVNSPQKKWRVKKMNRNNMKRGDLEGSKKWKWDYYAGCSKTDYYKAFC